ncbi:MAG: polysaccharide deacetylase family protein [Lachnospiraceae bacterium]|nr:polysaccharide deacetylase family protein [Lachnospiraceae bacterium]
MKQRNLIITIAVIAVSIALSVIIGFSVLNMADAEPVSPTEHPTVPPSIDPSNSPSAEPTETSSTETPTEGPTEPAKPYDMENTLKELSQADIDQIRASYNGDVKGYYTKFEMNERNRPIEASYFQAIFKQRVGEGIRVMNTEDNRITLSFVLTYEYDGNTEYVLNYLAAKDVKAVFFTSYSYANNYPAVIRRILEEGHILGSMGYALAPNGFVTMSLEEQYQDAKRMHEYIYETYGYSMTEFFYGNHAYSNQSMALLTKMGYHVDYYTIDYADSDHSKVIESDVFMQAMTERLHNGAIYSFHTTNTATLIILPSLIDSLRSKDFEVGLYN